jgi:hypothetical protein
VDAGERAGDRWEEVAAVCAPVTLPATMASFSSPHPLPHSKHAALAEQALAKVRVAVDALEEDAWMYEAPRYASTN